MNTAMSSARSSIRRHVVVGTAVVAFLAIGLGGWASTAEISGALIAPGFVVVDSNVKKVQHPTGGVVGEVRVRDGDHVKAGDSLVRLDGTVTRANLAIVHKGLIELYARKARLAAERDGTETVATPKTWRTASAMQMCRKHWRANASSLSYGGPRGSDKSNNCGSGSLNYRKRSADSRRNRPPRPRKRN